ncbi:MAG: alkaline phosphatase [Paludibacteraceae bacterium]|nr:alkaline phosphatase [Paludibacteraceae bacterium]
MKRFYLLLSGLVLAASLLAQPKYIFYFIGDGMGVNQVLGSEMYLAEKESIIGRKQLCMTQFPVAGYISTYSASNSITDSSAAGTCLATGTKTINGRLGLNPDGKSVQTIAECLKEEGWSIGITTSVSIDHATPASFYAHVEKRGDYYTIGSQLAESKFDFFGGAAFYQPDSKDGSGENLYQLCKQNGYSFCSGYKEYMEHGRDADKVILLPENEGKDSHYQGIGRIERAIDKQPENISLDQITAAGIDFLSRQGKPFFMMVEGGQIDWACHANDAATTIQEVLAFDKAIEQAFRFYKEHPEETLIIVTADHETGGFSLGNSHYELALRLLDNQKCSAAVLSDMLKSLHQKQGKNLSFAQVQELFRQQLGLYDAVQISADENKALEDTFKKMKQNKVSDMKTLYASMNALSDQAIQLLNKKAMIAWTTHSHTAASVPVFAIGHASEHFTGFYDNADLAPLMLKIALGKNESKKVVRTKSGSLKPMY